MNFRQMINRHISSEGNGFEIDDIMSGGKYPDWVTDRIVLISDKHKSETYPIGISNPESFGDLVLLVEEFEKKEN